MEPITSQQIKYFLSVARHLSFTKAARECYVSQTAISRQIKSLEAELEFPLFIRDTASVSLTPAGQYFCQYCQEITVQLSSVIKEARRRSVGEGTPLVIGISTAIEQQIILAHITYFRTLYPNIEMVVMQAPGSHLTAHLSEGKADILFTNSSEVEQLQNCIHLEVARPHDILMLPDRHQFRNAGEARVSPADVSDYPIIVIGDHSAFAPEPAVAEHLERLGFGGRRTIVTSNINSMTLMVAAGMGIAVVSSSFQLGSPPHVVFAEIEGVLHEETVVATRLKDHTNPAAALFFDALQNTLSAGDQPGQPVK